VLVTIITSSAIAAVISFSANLLFRWIDYKNDYYKEVIKRRLNIYAKIEDLIALFNPVISRGDGRLGRAIFCNGIQSVHNFKKN